jgi:hypothetical protein
VRSCHLSELIRLPSAPLLPTLCSCLPSLSSPSLTHSHTHSRQRAGLSASPSSPRHPLETAAAAAAPPLCHPPRPSPQRPLLLGLAPPRSAGGHRRGDSRTHGRALRRQASGHQSPESSSCQGALFGAGPMLFFLPSSSCDCSCQRPFPLPQPIPQALTGPFLACLQAALGCSCPRP